MNPAAFFFILTSPFFPGITATAITGGPPPCPTVMIMGVYKPSTAIMTHGCIHTAGASGPITVKFYGTAGAVPVATGQTVRFATGHGYYAYPPTANIGGS